MAQIEAGLFSLRTLAAAPTREELQEARAFVAAASRSTAAPRAPIGRSDVAASSSDTQVQAAPPTGAGAPAQSSAGTSSASATDTAVAAGALGASGAATAAPVDAAAPPESAKRRGRTATSAADVFSNIFGTGADPSAPQPLNPQHRASPSGSTGGTTGRSFARRKGRES